MEIIVIDDGINEGYYQTGKLLHNLEFDRTGKTFERRDYDPFQTSHATTCAGILKKYAPDCTLSSLKILTDSGGTQKQLWNALDWCIQREEKPLLIHMSLGSVSFADFEECGKRISQLLDKGAIIVAALNNNGEYTVPACFGGVIGVSAHHFYKEEQYFAAFGSIGQADVFASACHRLTDFRGNEEETAICNSYAAPLITAKLHNLIEQTGETKLAALFQLLSHGGENKAEKHLLPARPDFAFNFSSGGDQICGETRNNIVFLRTGRDIEKLNRLKGRKERSKVISFLPLSEKKRDALLQTADVLYWEPAFYENAIQRWIKPGQNCEVPVVQLSGGEDIRQLTSALCRLFRGEDYYARIVAAEAEAFEYETDWIPAGIAPGEFMGFYEKLFGCDIILYYSDRAADFPADFQISAAGDQIQCSAEELPEPILIDCGKWGEGLASYLFQVVEGYFEKEE